MTGHPRARRPTRPLDEARLDELALRYVGRFATSRAKLTAYLERKIAERGWDGQHAPAPEAVAERCASLGYVDDSAYALAKARALAGRGYGKRRLTQALRHAGIDQADGQAAERHAEEEAVESALRLARRRRIGPFAAASATDPREREKAIAMLVRAGHGFLLARAIVALDPGEPFDPAELPQDDSHTQA